jgi:hypothetical protein
MGNGLPQQNMTQFNPMMGPNNYTNFNVANPNMQTADVEKKNFVPGTLESILGFQQPPTNLPLHFLPNQIPVMQTEVPQEQHSEKQYSEQPVTTEEKKNEATPGLSPEPMSSTDLEKVEGGEQKEVDLPETKEEKGEASIEIHASLHSDESKNIDTNSLITIKEICNTNNDNNMDIAQNTVVANVSGDSSAVPNVNINYQQNAMAVQGPLAPLTTQPTLNTFNYPVPYQQPYMMQQQQMQYPQMFPHPVAPTNQPQHPTQAGFPGGGSKPIGGKSVSFQLPSSRQSGPKAHGSRHFDRTPPVKKERTKRSKILRALCFPFSREIKMMALKKFDTEQIAEVMCYSLGEPLTDEELIKLDKNPLGRPDVTKAPLQQVFEIIFRMWNKEYCRLSYFPRAQCDSVCGAVWIGKSIESVLYADVTEPNIPKAVFVYPKRKPYIMSSQMPLKERQNRSNEMADLTTQMFPNPFF